MPYTDDPINNPIDRIRLRIGDTEEECEELSDSVYQYLLSLHNNNENRSTLDALKAVLAKYARYANERAGKLEIDYQSRYRSYQAMYDKLLKDNSFTTIGVPFAGGVYKDDTGANRTDTTKNTNPLYEGFSTNPVVIEEGFI